MQSVLIGLSGFLLVGWAWVQWVEPNWLRLTRKTVRLPKRLPQPLTVLHLSDLHFTRDRRALSRFFDRLSRFEVDFVFVTGDLIDDDRGIGPCIRNLKKLKPRKGTYVVLGNHDYQVYPPFEGLIFIFTGKNLTWPRREIGQLKEALTEAGFHLLLNRNIPVPLGAGEQAYVIGTDDPVTGRANLDQAFEGLQDGVLHLALTHSPMTFPALGKRGVDVAFAGHTHGGQVRLPFLGPIPLSYRMTPIIDSTDRFGFVGLISRGMGAQPIADQRLFCRPEALLVRIEGT